MPPVSTVWPRAVLVPPAVRSVRDFTTRPSVCIFCRSAPLVSSRVQCHHDKSFTSIPVGGRSLRQHLRQNQWPSKAFKGFGCRGTARIPESVLPKASVAGGLPVSLRPYDAAHIPSSRGPGTQTGCRPFRRTPAQSLSNARQRGAHLVLGTFFGPAHVLLEPDTDAMAPQNKAQPRRRAKPDCNRCTASTAVCRMAYLTVENFPRQARCLSADYIGSSPGWNVRARDKQSASAHQFRRRRAVAFSHEPPFSSTRSLELPHKSPFLYHLRSG